MADGATETASRFTAPARPTSAESAYLRPGLNQPGRKLPLFDAAGQPVSPRVIRA